MKVFVIFIIGLCSLVYNLVNFNFIDFLGQANLIGFWDSALFNGHSGFYLVFDILFSFTFMVNIYQFHKILLIFGV